jgi:hypothetical protein
MPGLNSLPQSCGQTLRATCFVLLLSLAAVAQAAPPWTSLLPFKKVEATPQSLTTENGPWMIMAMSFSGDEAEEEAYRLALELRRDLKLEAYTHEQAAELEETVIGLGVDSRGRPKRMRHIHGTNSAEHAVLVGNFKSFDDPEAAKTLEKLRYLQPKSLGGLGQPEGNETFSANHMRAFYRKVTRNPEQKRRGPMGKAFITRNPLAPQDEVARQSLDPFVEEMNLGETYSLLGNPGRYTVVIGTYRGVSAFNETDFEKSIRKRDGLNKIDEAAINAKRVAAELRKSGIDAFVFHDRHESIVTVGSFDDLGDEGEGERIDLRPEVAAVIKRFEAGRNSIPGTDQLGLQPKAVAGVPLDVSPRIIVVPRKSLADVYR